MADYVKGLPWFGSKSFSDNGYGYWILQNFPYPAARNYIEPFVGGGSIILNKPPAAIEVINDIDPELMNFYSMSVSEPERLQRMINETLYSESIFNEAKGVISDSNSSDLDRAWAFYVILWQRTFYPSSLLDSKWCLILGDKTGTFGGKKKRIDVLAFADRLKNVQIANRDAKDILKQSAKLEDCDIYCDPPYFSSGYNKYAQNEIDVEDFTELLQSQKGRVAISGHNGEWNHLNWRKVSLSVAKPTTDTSRRDEEIWMNYPYEESYEFHHSAGRLFEL